MFFLIKLQINIDMSINKRSKEDNKIIFDRLYKNREAIENTYGSPLLRERMDDKKSSRISDKLLMLM